MFGRVSRCLPQAQHRQLGLGLRPADWQPALEVLTIVSGGRYGVSPDYGSEAVYEYAISCSDRGD